MKLEKFTEMTAKCAEGQVLIRSLRAEDAEAAAAFYEGFLINEENYKARLGMLQNDDFHAMGGKYEAVSAADFAAMAASGDWVLLGAWEISAGAGPGSEPQGGARKEPRLLGLIRAEVSGAFFAELDDFNFKPEYAGLTKMWGRLRERGAIAGGLDIACRAPETFPSLALVLHYAMAAYLSDEGFDCAVNLICKNIWFRDERRGDSPEAVSAAEETAGSEHGAAIEAAGAATTTYGGAGSDIYLKKYGEDDERVRNLDTFDYNAYNAYKMFGYEHVGYLEKREIKLSGVEAIVCAEPQLIAGLDLFTQKNMLQHLMEREEIKIER